MIFAHLIFFHVNVTFRRVWSRPQSPKWLTVQPDPNNRSKCNTWHICPDDKQVLSVRYHKTGMAGSCCLPLCHPQSALLQRRAKRIDAAPLIGATLLQSPDIRLTVYGIIHPMFQPLVNSTSRAPSVLLSVKVGLQACDFAGLAKARHGNTYCYSKCKCERRLNHDTPPILLDMSAMAKATMATINTASS